MTVTILAPVKLALTTALQDIGVATPTGHVRTYDLRFANVGAADATGDVVLTDGTTVITRAKNFPVPFNQPGSAPDMEQKLVVPAGWKLQAKASATSSVEASLVNCIDADIADFA